MNTLPEKPNQHTEPGNDEKGRVMTVTRQEYYEGLIPHPRLMADWEAIIPGAAERILRKFEAQSEHRIDIESRVVRANNIKQVGGLVCGFIIALVTIAGGIYTAIKGHTGLGGSLSFTGLAILVGAFVTNTFWKPDTKKRRKEE